MQYPSRVPQHVAETSSNRALEACLPDQWIVRHLAERDYGLDYIVEIVHPDGQVRGDIAAIQLKNTAELCWVQSHESLYSTISGIRATTIAYWMRLPMPVVLCVHDSASGSVHWANPREQVRERYNEYRGQHTFGFRVEQSQNLRTSRGLRSLLQAYRRELSHPRFVEALLALVANLDSHVEYLTNSLDRDAFLAVEGLELAQLLHLHYSCTTVADYLGLELSLPSIATLFERDERIWGERNVLHESTRDDVVRQLISAYVEALDGGLALVERQLPYWYSVNPHLLESISDRPRTDMIDELKSRLFLDYL